MSSSRSLGSWAIQLGKQLGEIELGSTLNEVVYLIKKQHIQNEVEIVYSSHYPQENDIMIHLPEEDIWFRFDVSTQVLKTIECHIKGKAQFTYHRKPLANAEITPTFQSVYNMFGPTYPGKFNPQDKTYLLEYKEGICFTFDIPEEYQSQCMSKDHLPKELPDGSSPMLSRLVLFFGKSLQQLELRRLPNRIYDECLEVTISDRISCKFLARKKEFQLGSSVQEILTQIGRPAGIFRKPQESFRDVNYQAYFHNYPQLGMDILYDPIEHTAIKLILHANFPGHRDFCNYVKLNFRLILEKGYKSPVLIESDSKWSSICTKLSKDKVSPIIHDEGQMKNPFGATFFYTATDNLTFEITQNDHLTTVEIC